MSRLNAKKTHQDKVLAVLFDTDRQAVFYTTEGFGTKCCPSRERFFEVVLPGILYHFTVVAIAKDRSKHPFYGELVSYIGKGTPLIEVQSEDIITDSGKLLEMGMKVLEDKKRVFRIVSVYVEYPTPNYPRIAVGKEHIANANIYSPQEFFEEGLAELKIQSLMIALPKIVNDLPTLEIYTRIRNETADTTPILLIPSSEGIVDATSFHKAVIAIIKRTNHQYVKPKK